MKARVACCLSLGAAPEPYLGAFLRSIEPAIDALAVNDNSGLERNPNADVLLRSRFARQGSLAIVRTRFDGFAKMRADALAAAARLSMRPEWILYADADEVHGTQLRVIVRDVLPSLSNEVGFVDAYIEHLFGTFGWSTDVGRRITFFRYGLEVRWNNLVHERMVRTPGRTTIVLPYVYNHYGNVAALASYAAKNDLYERLAARAGETVRHREPDAVQAEMIAMVRPYRRRHPLAVLKTIEHMRRDDAERLAQTEYVIRSSRTPLRVLRGSYHALNDAVRVRLRRLERLGRYRFPASAR